MRPLGRLRSVITLFLFAGMMLAGLIGPAVTHVRAQAPHVLLLKVDGIINPVKERLIARTIRQADEDGATLVIIELDTPGGLLSSTRAIVEDLLEAPVPVAVYVTPKGARAGSAGTFITAAANFAVMAPGTNIGAATPVAAGGRELPETLATKIENDAAALIRAIAQERGRNENKLEDTVRKASSFTAQEAVGLNVVDFIAEDLDDLLAQVDGKVVDTGSGPRFLDTRDLDQRRVKKNLLENFLELISDPNVSFILLTVGGLGIVIELFNPGLIAPGVVGVICLLLAFLALGNLPVNWIGVAFILVAVALAVLEATVAGFGILGVGAVICFVVGGLILFGGSTPTLPSVSVSRWLLAGFALVFAFTALYVGRTVYQSRRAGSEPTGPEMVGATGTVTGELAPRGVIRIGSETWTAVSEDGNLIGVGEAVRVIQVEGLILTVSRQNDTDRAR